MVFTLIKGLLIGMAASIPIGPIAIFVFQKSMSSGWKSGMFAALGCVLLDTIFATCSVAAYNVIEDFISNHVMIIEVLGGLVIIGVGAAMIFSKPKAPGEVQKHSKRKIALDMTKSFFMGFSNPGAFAWMLALYAAFNMHLDQIDLAYSIAVVLSIACGSFIYWLGFSWLASRGNNHFKVSTLLKVNRISGFFVSLFGAYMLTAGVLLTQ